MKNEGKLMKTLFKKGSVFLLALTTAVAAASLNMPVKAEESSAISGENVVGLGVEHHTQSEIRDFVNTHAASLDQPIEYKTKPSLAEPYSPGVLSDETVNSALNMLNQVRYIAGVDANVTHDADKAALASAGTLLNYLNKNLSHTPERPTVLEGTNYDSLYADGCEGAKNSNIAYRGYLLPESLNYIIINGWCADHDDDNISAVGHRRRFLKPNLGSVGFGATIQSSTQYTAAYMDPVFTPYPDVYVAWPAQEMPVQYFNNKYPWSLSLGYVPTGDVSVSMTRKADNATWNFSNASSDGDFHVNKETYGSYAAIIFRPSGINIQSGDTYDVKVVIGDSTTIQYEVNFFDLDGSDEDDSTGGAGSETDPGNDDEGGSSYNPGNDDEDGSSYNPGDDEKGGSSYNPGDDEKGGSSYNSGSNAANTSAGTMLVENIVDVDWNAAETAIANALQAEDENAYIEAGTSYTVPASAVRLLAGGKTAVMLRSGSSFAVSISGQDVKKDSPALKLNFSFADVIPEAVSRKVTDGAVLSRAFSMTDKGSLPFKVDVHINLGAENAGKTAILYYYDESRKVMRPVGSFVITSTGQAMFAVRRGDEYIVVVPGQSYNPAGESYAIVSGDTLSRIARRHGVSLNDILRANPQIKDPNKIYTNQVISIP